jgi:hypothetical protein
MSTAGLPTIWELVAEGAATLPEPFPRSALMNWVSARRPDVGVASIAVHIQFATANATHTGHNPFAEREPLLHRVGRGQYVRYRETDDGGSGGAPVRAGRVVLSAKHGLLDPDDVISPYDVQIDDQPAAYRSAWGEWVVAQLADRVQLEGVTVEVHGGVDFAQPLRQPLARRGAALDIPLPGTWRAADRQSFAEPQAGPADAPVRVALHRLRSLIGRNRAAGEGDHASAS